MPEKNIEQHLPLTEAILFILLSLAPAAKHGYGIIKEAVELSDGRVHLSTGTLYGALSRLLEQGWIERVEGNEQDETGRPRKEYRLTSLGQRILKSEIERMQSLVATARLRLAKESK